MKSSDKNIELEINSRHDSAILDDSFFMDIDMYLKGLDLSFSNGMVDESDEESTKPKKEPKKGNSLLGKLICITLISFVSVGIGISVVATQTSALSIYRASIALGFSSKSLDMRKEFPLNITHRMISTDNIGSVNSKIIPLFLFDTDFSDAIVPDILSKCFRLNSVSLQSFLNYEKELSIHSNSCVFAKSLCDFAQTTEPNKSIRFQVFASLPNPSKAFISLKNELSRYNPEEYLDDNLFTRSIRCKYNTKLDEKDFLISKRFMEFVVILEGTSSTDNKLRASLEMLASMYGWDYGEKEDKCIGNYVSRKAHENNNPKLSLQNIQDLMESNQFDFSLYKENLIV